MRIINKQIKDPVPFCTECGRDEDEIIEIGCTYDTYTYICKQCLDKIYHLVIVYGD